MTEHTPKQIALATLADDLEALAAAVADAQWLRDSNMPGTARYVELLPSILAALRAMENNDAG